MGEKESDFNKKLRVAMNMPPEDKPPFISMNKLAEYMQADAIRRRQIVKSLKKDSTFIKAHYSKVYKLFPKYFKSDYDSSLIKKEISKIESVENKTDWEESDNANSILALKHLEDSDLPDLADYKIVSNLEKIDSIILSGVKVTLKPDLYLRNIHSGKIGAVKCHIAKTETNRLEEKGRKYAASLLKIGFISKGYKSKEIDNNACISIDIFEKSYNVSPRAYKRRKSRLEAACEEFSLRWQSL